MNRDCKHTSRKVYIIIIMDKKILRNAAAYLFTTLISLILVIYLIHQFRAISSGMPEMKIAVIETGIDSLDVSGYLFLDEMIIEYEGEGTVVANVVDGTPVSVLDAPVSVYRSDDENISQKAAYLLWKIEFLKKSQSMPDKFSDGTKYDRDVKNDYFSLIDAVESGNLSLGISKTYDCFSSTTRRAIAIKSSNGYSEVIAALESERNSLLRTAVKISDIIPGCSGTYYSQIDGYESLMNSSAVESGYGSVESAISEVLNNRGGNNNQNAYKKSAGKILKRGKWYYVCPILSSDIDKLTQNKKYTLCFNEDNQLKVDMIYQKTLTKFGEDVGFAVFYSNVIPEDFSLSRYKSAKIELNSYSGMLIPKTSIRYKDGKTGVYVADSNRARFRVIDIIGESDGCVIIRPGSGKDEDGVPYLSLYETVIISAKDLFDGKYIDLTS